MSKTASLELQRLNLPSGLSCDVFVGGDPKAPPLLYLHPANGVSAGDPFALALAEKCRVYAPLSPGFNDLDELENIRTVSDICLFYDDVMTALGLESVAVAGHSFGGMFAAEFAAHFPMRVSSLALIAPVGLWNEDYPVLDIFAIPPEEMPNYLWGDPKSEAAVKAMAAMMGAGKAESGDSNGTAPGGTAADRVEDMMESVIRTVQGLVTASKFMMPIPERGLIRRLYRISVPVLLVWGEKDQVVPFRYHNDFAGHLVNASGGVKTHFLPEGGHMVSLEYSQEVAEAVAEHIA